MIINKIFIIGVIAIVIIVFLGIIFLFISQKNSYQDTIQPVSGKYLNFSNGSLSKIYLLNSTAKYGTYEYNLTPVPTLSVLKGDPCVIINATIRSDYDKDYWINVNAQLYNTTGEKVGQVTQLFAPWKPFEQVYSKSNVTRTFELYVKYDKNDVESYDIWIYEQLFDEPSP